MTTKPVSLRLPQAIFDALEARAKTTGQTMPDLIMQTLAHTLGTPTLAPASPLAQRVSTLEQQVSRIEQQIAALSSHSKG